MSDATDTVKVVILLTVDWHAAWTTYEWWRDIGTGVLGVVAGVLVGVSTLAVAIRSHHLAESVKRDQAARDKRVDEADYESRLLKYIERVVDTGLDYVAGAVEGWFIGSVEHRRAQTAMRGRLRMLRAVASGSDEDVAKDLFETFTTLSEHGGPGVQTTEVSLLLDYITALAARENDRAEILAHSQALRAKVEKMPKPSNAPMIF